MHRKEINKNTIIVGFPGGSVAKNLPPMQETQVQSRVWEDPIRHGATRPVHHDY